MLDLADDSVLRARFTVVVAASFLIPALLQAGVASLAAENPIGTPELFVLVVFVSISLGAFGATMLIVRAHRTNEVEIGYLGLFWFVLTVLTISHAVVTPGVITDGGANPHAIWFWAIPAALLTSVPALLRRSQVGAAIDADWKLWVTVFQFAIVAFCAISIIFPDLVPGAPQGSARLIIVAISIGGCLLHAFRHLYLARVAKSPGPLLIAISFGLIGASSLVWLNFMPFSQAFWLSHFLTIFGILLGSTSTLAVYRQTNEVRPMIEGLIEVDPRCALEYGIDPVIQYLVADLNAADSIRREHVERTVELAMTIGKKMNFGGTGLRDIGATALLHDVGMLVIPSSILNKTGELDENEREVMKRHTRYGAQLLQQSPALRHIADYVEACHERMDGKGYPFKLHGPQISIPARITSACDAFDAMTHHRLYRPRLDYEETLDILERQAGLRWDRRVVETLARTARHRPAKKMPERLDATFPVGCDCIPDLRAS